MNVGGLRWAADLRAPLEAADKGIGLNLKTLYDNNASNLVRRSDQWPFLQHGVPAVEFFTGLHPDYHTRLRPAGEDQLSEDRKDRAPRAPGELGPGEPAGAPEGRDGLRREVIAPMTAAARANRI